MLGEGREKADVRRGHLALLKGDAIEQSHDAFRAGSQIVDRLGGKLDDSKIADAALAILPLEIPLDDAFAMLKDDKGVDIPYAPLGDRLIQPSDHLGGKLFGSDHGRMLLRDGDTTELLPLRNTPRDDFDCC